MKPVNGFDSARAYTDFEKLPASGQVIGILDAEEVQGEKGNRLVLKFDICEGEFKNYYSEQFKNSQFEDTKYKGNYSIFIPKEDGSEDDEKTLRRFKTNISILEECNPGFHWDWDEKKLKGLKAGMIFQDKEWSYNGKTGFTAQPYGLKSIEDIRAGKFKVPKPKQLSNTSASAPTYGNSNADDFAEIEDDGDLPF